MHKVVFLLFIPIILASCKNNPKVKAVECQKESFKVRLCLEKAFAYVISQEHDADSSTAYVMEFLKGEPGFPPKDTLICFCKSHEDYMPTGLRGLMKLGEYKVLVFDEKGIGEDFYNRDSLKSVNLRDLNLPSSGNLIDYYVYILNGGKYMELWEMSPEDFDPIMIDGRSDEPHP